MYPRAHRQFRDEDVASFREQDWRFSRYHLYLGISLHDFLDPREGKLMNLELVFLGLKMVDRLLPVGSKDVFVLSRQSLVDLSRKKMLVIASATRVNQR